MFDHHFHHREDDTNQFHQNIHTQLSAINPEVDDDDDYDEMALGAEAGAGLLGNMSDDDNNVSHSLNVSPTMEDDDPPELIDHKPLQTPPFISPTKQAINSTTIDQTIANTMRENHNQNQFLPIPNNQSNDDYQDLYDNNHLTTDYPSMKQNSVSINISIFIFIEPFFN